MSIATRAARPRPTTHILGFSPGSAWAKIALGNSLKHTFTATLPADHWGQVDVWIPGTTFTACFDGDLRSFTADFLSAASDGIFATDSQTSMGDWRWWTDRTGGGVAATGPAPATTYTVKYHVHGGNIDWYVNGVLLFTDSGVTPGSTIVLGENGEGCCCEVYYFTNVKLGTSDGGEDIFADDFSGGLGNWERFPPLASVAVVAFTSSAPCPTVTLSPPRGQAGDTITVSGSGFAAFSPLSMVILNTPIESFAATTDGAGAFSTSFVLPSGLTPTGSSTETLYVIDNEANAGCVEFGICGTRPADGISTATDPVLATGGITNTVNDILDYIFHDGAHWVLWQDRSSMENLSTFPPPANHTMNATRISADGSSVVDYPIDTDYVWGFGSSNVDDPGVGSSRTCPPGISKNAPVWSYHVYFTHWSKPVYDAKFASDGTTLWVGCVTAETIPYPWLDNKDAVSPNPGSANQCTPLAALTAGYTNFATGGADFYLRYWTTTDGVINFYQNTAFPITDAGTSTMGVWAPPKVVMFSFDGGAFNRIGEIPAFYCPGITDGYDHTHDGSVGVPLQAQQSPRGSLYSRVSLAASENDPGVCHCVWSEGGDWGRVGDGDACNTTGLPTAGGSAITWDAGPVNRDYRVNYTRWDSIGKTFDNDIFHSHVDRTNWTFFSEFPGAGPPAFPFGYTWPDPLEFAGILAHDLRNDNAAGTPYLFAVIPQTIQNGLLYPTPDSADRPWLDFEIVYGDTLHVYDLSSGSAVEVQTLDLATLAPSDAEFRSLYTSSYLVGHNIYGPLDADAVYTPTTLTNADTPNAISSFGVIDKGFGISLLYDDPGLGDTPVYLFHIALLKRYVLDSNGNQRVNAEGGAGAVARAFYRIPWDMSAGFDYLDGERAIGFTLVKEPFGSSPPVFNSDDFFSDPKNLWVPAPSLPTVGGSGSAHPGLWFDRVCNNDWEAFSGAWTPNVVNYWRGSSCPGFYYDPAADSITAVARAVDSPIAGDPMFAVTTQFICRGCRSCPCGVGIHIAHRF